MEEWKKDRIGSALKGDNPTVIARMKSGFAVMGDTQFLPGYCVLLACPRVSSINDLNMSQRRDFLSDMCMIGDAIIKVCGPSRLNYDILGNTDAFLHAHLFPRYHWEEESLRKQPVFSYPRENWNLEEYQFSESRHGKLKSDLSAVLQRLIEMNRG